MFVARLNYSDEFDTQGDLALATSLMRLRKQGSTLIIVTHRNNVLEQVDKIMVLANGEMVAYDDPATVMAMLSGSNTTPLANRQSKPGPLASAES